MIFGFAPVPHWLLFRGRGRSVISKAQLLCCVFSFPCSLSWPCVQLHQLVFTNKIFVTSGPAVGQALESISTPQLMAFHDQMMLYNLTGQIKASTHVAPEEIKELQPTSKMALQNRLKLDFYYGLKMECVDV